MSAVIIICFLLGTLAGFTISALCSSTHIKEAEKREGEAKKRAEFWEWKWGELVEVTGRRIAEEETERLGVRLDKITLTALITPSEGESKKEVL
jgi:hypothetical protein